MYGAMRGTEIIINSNINIISCLLYYSGTKTGYKIRKIIFLNFLQKTLYKRPDIGYYRQAVRKTGADRTLKTEQIHVRFI